MAVRCILAETRSPTWKSRLNLRGAMEPPDSTAAGQLAAGDSLGPYCIEQKLGRGGMAEVYSARDTRLGRTVAIKILRSEFARQDDFRQRFEREGRAISALNHPHICSLYDVGE